MNAAVSVLDCTLREAPIDNLIWGELSIHKTIRGLEKAGVEIIEVGFLKDNSYVQGSTSFQKVEEIRKYINPKNDNTMYVALVDYGRYDLKNLQPYDGTSIDALRICFKHNEITEVLDYANKIKEKGYKVCIQHVDTLGYSENEILHFVDDVNILKPYAYSIVDTFGAMYQNDMLRLAKIIDSRLDTKIRLGFHGHNNLMLADSNAQRFIEEIGNHREIIVDTSLYGCGRGAGNAHTELICQYINSNYSEKYDVNEVLDLIDAVIRPVEEKTTWGYSIPFFISGMHNAHTFNVKHLLNRHNIKSKDLRGIIEKLDDVQKKSYDYALLERLYVEYFDNPVDDSEDIELLTKSFKNRDILIIAPGKSIRDDMENILTYISINKPIVIGVNNLIEGYKFDYLFYSGALRYQNLQYQSYRKAGSPQIIITSNIKSKSDENEIIINYSSLIKFGWINIDSSAVLLLRLLIKCEVDNVSIAGMDGYSSFGKSFFSDELDTNLSEKDRRIHTEDNISMIKDIKNEHPMFTMNFITDSVYKKIFNGAKNV